MMVRVLLFAMLFPCQALTQSFSEKLQQRLDNYYRNVIPLKMHLFTNQPEYAAGDTVFFKVNLMTAQDNRPVEGKSIIWIALLDRGNTKLIVIQCSIMNGMGSNQIILPKTLPSGHYWLSAWTDWMPAEKHMHQRTGIRVGTRKFEEPSLVAAPEGGSLIDGLRCKVVVKSRPLVNGYLIENDKRILEFTVGGDGTTSFYVTPKVGQRYEVVSENRYVALPEVQPDGVGITVTPLRGKNSVRVYLTMHEASAYREKKLHVIMSQQGILYNTSDIVFRDQSFLQLDLPFGEMPRGLAQITVFDDEGSVITERLVYNSFAPPVTAALTLPKKQFNTREKIQFTINVKDGDAPTEASLAATVFHTGFTPGDTAIAHTLVNAMHFYADAGNDDVALQAHEKNSTIDNKLVLLRWRQFDWNNLSPPGTKGYHSQYLHYNGKAFDSETNTLLPDSSKITFFLQNDVTTYEAYTDAAGRFSVTMLVDFYDTNEVFYRVEHGGALLDGARVTIDQHSTPDAWSHGQQKTKTTYTDFFERRAMVTESYSYHLKETQPIASARPHSLLEDEIFGPDITVVMNDYHLFPSMIETLREVIPVAQHRKLRGRDVVRVFNEEERVFYEADPVYVIDGVMTDDMEYFLSLNPSDIETIKLVNRADKLRMFGAVGKGGIFIVETRIPENHAKVHRSVRSLTLQGLNKPVIRTNVEHAEAQRLLRVPDLRTNLLWSPSIQTDTSGKATIDFYASDVPGVYRIVGEGVTGNGKLFTFEDEFEVVFDHSRE